MNNSIDKLRFFIKRNFFLIATLLIVIFILFLLKIEKITLPTEEFTLKDIFFPLATIIAYIYIYLGQKKYLSIKPSIKIKVETFKNFAKISCIYENNGGSQISPKNVGLFIDQGVLNDKEKTFFEFPFVLRHETEENKDDCKLSRLCRSESNIEEYIELIVPTRFKDSFRTHIMLRHLSHESIKYIDPGEKFSEDIVIRLPEKGVYRAICIFTTKEPSCICSSKEFFITELGGDECLSNDQREELSTVKQV